ncbi:MAG: tRNA pseudouridine(55) synthase TruB [Desulfobacterales bacterium]
MRHEANGIIVIDKPPGMSSAKVVAQVKRIIGARKLGHTGTLDPMATGLLICCVNDATRLARFFLTGSKTYQAVLSLGSDTDTQDSTGTVLATSDVSGVLPEAIASACKRFTGAIEQQPPIYSALKHKGVPLYKLARRGQPVEKPPRPVFISDITVSEIDLPHVRFTVTCSAGTYIRTLCADIGAVLGCGGHLSELRRVESCGFSLKDSVTPHQLEEAYASGASGALEDRIISMTDALEDMPSYTADDGLIDKVRHGVRLAKKEISGRIDDSPEGFFKIVNKQNQLIAVLSRHESGDPYRYCCVFQN